VHINGGRGYAFEGCKLSRTGRAVFLSGTLIVNGRTLPRAQPGAATW